MPAARADAAPDAAQLWLATIQALADRAAHEIRGALNGVALNVEVVRSRTSRPGADAGAVAPFASAAAAQLESLMAQTEALLSLIRPPRGPADVAIELRRLLDLAEPIARAQGSGIVLERPLEAGGTVSVAPDVLRLALAGLVLGALEAERGVRIGVLTDDRVRVRATADGAGLRLRDDIASRVVDAGVQVEQTTDGVTLAFARARDADSGEL